MQIAFLFANWISFHNAVFCKNVVLFLFHFLRHLYPRRQLSSYSCQNNWVSWFPPNPGAQLRGTVQNPPRLCSQSLETSLPTQLWILCLFFIPEYFFPSSAKAWSYLSACFLHPHLGPGCWYSFLLQPKLLSHPPSPTLSQLLEL